MRKTGFNRDAVAAHDEPIADETWEETVEAARIKQRYGFVFVGAFQMNVANETLETDAAVHCTMMDNTCAIQRAVAANNAGECANDRPNASNFKLLQCEPPSPADREFARAKSSRLIEPKKCTEYQTEPGPFSPSVSLHFAAGHELKNIGPASKYRLLQFNPTYVSEPKDRPAAGIEQKSKVLISNSLNLSVTTVCSSGIYMSVPEKPTIASKRSASELERLKAWEAAPGLVPAVETDRMSIAASTEGNAFQLHTEYLPEPVQEWRQKTSFLDAYLIQAKGSAAKNDSEPTLPHSYQLKNGREFRFSLPAGGLPPDEAKNIGDHLHKISTDVSFDKLFRLHWLGKKPESR